jgi:thymidylate synthase
MIQDFVEKTEGQYNEERQYLKLIENILSRGSFETGRNGNTYSVFGSSMRFSLENNRIPLLTTKQLAWKTCLKELFWFICGDTDNQKLVNQGVHIWDANSSRSFLDSRGLVDREEHDLGPIYGFQWRHYNAPYINCNTDYTDKGIDQLQYIIDNLTSNIPEVRNSRRLIMTAWNPCQLNEMALPPCHVLAQFQITHGNKLSCLLYQRSGDVGLGVPFNIASYSFLTHILAHHCNLEAYEFIYTLGNSHIYDDHVSPLKEQILRNPYEFPSIKIRNHHANINDYTMEDIEIINYKYHPKIPMNMRS